MCSSERASVRYLQSLANIMFLVEHFSELLYGNLSFCVNVITISMCEIILSLSVQVCKCF